MIKRIKTMGASGAAGTAPNACINKLAKIHITQQYCTKILYKNHKGFGLPLFENKSAGDCLGGVYAF